MFDHVIVFLVLWYIFHIRTFPNFQNYSTSTSSIQDTHVVCCVCLKAGIWILIFCQDPDSNQDLVILGP